MGQGTILIVDDEPAMRSALRRALGHRHYAFVMAGSGGEALAAFEGCANGEIAVAVVDLRMPDMNGLQVLVGIKRRSPETRVLLLTGHATIPIAVQAMRCGADDFLEKPFVLDALRERVRAAARAWAVRRPPDTLTEPPCREQRSINLVGESAKMRHLRQLARQLSGSEAVLLIEGESGTGKEEFAKAVHCSGPRASDPFVPIDMSTLGGPVIESELFGHVKGAFTGAESTRKGMLRAARKGTVLLDEIGDLPLNMQTKLLRVLQERVARPVGSEEAFAVEARLIAATNKDLSAAVTRGEFREDLYHRLNVVSVAMPPLRERKADILLLAQRFLSKYGNERPTVSGISQEAEAALVAYDWPGNVRELENAILRALIMGGSELIQIADLPASVTAGAGGLCRRVPQADKDEFAESPPREPRDGTLASREQQAIIEALEHANGNRARAAEILEIGIATLYRKMRRYQIADRLRGRATR